MGSCGRRSMSGSVRTSQLRKWGERWRGLSVSERLRIWRGILVGLFEDCNSEREGCDVEPGAAARSSSAGGGVFCAVGAAASSRRRQGPAAPTRALGGPDSLSRPDRHCPLATKRPPSRATQPHARREGHRQIRSEAPPPADRWPFIDEDAGRRRAFECVGRSATGQYFNGDQSLPMHSTRTAPPEAGEDYPRVRRRIDMGMAGPPRTAILACCSRTGRVRR